MEWLKQAAKACYSQLVRFVSRRAVRDKLSKGIVYLMSFPSNNQGLIEALHRDYPVTVMYTSDCRQEAEALAKQQVSILPLDNPFVFFWQCVPLMTRSRVVVCDNYFPFLGYLQKHSDAVFVQIWHATGAIKTFGYEDRQLKHRTKKDLARFTSVYQSFDYYVVASKQMADVFQRSYGAREEQMLYFGLPRTDQFVQLRKAQTEQQDQTADHKKVIVYTPTYREGQTELPLLDIPKMAKELGDSYRLIVRLHPHVQKLADKVPHTPFVSWDGHLQPTAQLLETADLLITDYSSVVFDYTLLKQRASVIYFWYDREQYEEKTGLQPHLTELLNGPVVATTEELIAAVKTHVPTNQDQFNRLWNTYNDGAATARFVTYVHQLMDGMI